MAPVTLTPEQEEVLSVEAIRTIGPIVGECADCCTEATRGDLCVRCKAVYAALMEFGRDIAGWLLEPVEKERDAEREHRKINERLLENMSVRCEQREGELSEAREENTRLREQLAAVKERRG